MNRLTFDKNQVVFEQGSFSKTMYDIVSGKVGIYYNFGTEGEKLLSVLGPGETFGEMGMIEVYPRSATVTALEDGTVISEIIEEDLPEYFKSEPEKLLSIMRQLSHRLRETDKMLADVCRTVYENEEAERGGFVKSKQVEAMNRYFYEAYLKNISMLK